MIEVESSQEILVCFALAAVLRDDESRNDFKDFAGAQKRAVPELLGRNDHLFQCARRAVLRPGAGSADGRNEYGRCAPHGFFYGSGVQVDAPQRWSQGKIAPSCIRRRCSPVEVWTA